MNFALCKIRNQSPFGIVSSPDIDKEVYDLFYSTRVPYVWAKICRLCVKTKTFINVQK